MIVEISMPYIGKRLSVNHYMGKNKYGAWFIYPEVVQWMQALTASANYHLRNSKVKQPPTIHLSGIFKDYNNAPDLNNLHKVIADALQGALGINDREFRFHDEGYTIDKSKDPTLIVGIEVEAAI